MAMRESSASSGNGGRGRRRSNRPGNSQAKGPHCQEALWKAGGEIRPTEGVSRAKEETPRRSKLSGFVTEGVMEKGADFGILSRSPLMKASGMSDTDDSHTEREAIDARLPLDAWPSKHAATRV